MKWGKCPFCVCAMCLVAFCSLKIWASSRSCRWKLAQIPEGRCYMWNITLHFIRGGRLMLQTNQKPHTPTLNLFHLNMTTIILQKIRSVSLLFSGWQERRWRLFKDKCPGVGDPRSNQPPPARRGGKKTCTGHVAADCVWMDSLQIVLPRSCKPVCWRSLGQFLADSAALLCG